MGKFRQAPSKAPAKRQIKGSSNKATTKCDTPRSDVSKNSAVHASTVSGDQTPAQKRQRVTIEEIPDEDDQRSTHETPKEELGEHLDTAQVDENLIKMTAQLVKGWSSLIYAFFRPLPMIQIINGRHCHIFACARKACRYACRRFLDTRDTNSTGNLRKHVKSCWGEEALAAAEDATSVDDAREWVVKGLNQSGSITASFERKGKGTVTYSNRQHTAAEMRTELVRWVAESLRPFTIVSDRGFQCLMKTGQPNYYLPSSSTVSRDVKAVFTQTRKQIAKLLQVCC
jgi:hypothetical protein